MSRRPPWQIRKTCGNLAYRPVVVEALSHFHQADDLGTGGAAVALRVNAGHDPEYPLRSAGSAIGYYLQDGKEPPGQWAGKGAEALGLTGQVDPEVYRNLFGKLVTPTGEKLYTGRPPRYVTGPGESDSADDVAAAVAGLGPFTTPAEVRRTRAKVLGSTGASVPFYDLTFSATKSPSLLQASYAAAAVKARAAGHHDQAAEYERRVRAIDEAAVETARQLVGWPSGGRCSSAPGITASIPGSSGTRTGRSRRCSRSMTTAAANPTCTCTSCCSTGRCAPTTRPPGTGKWRALYGRPLWKEQLGLAADGRADLRPAAGPAGHPDGPAGERERVRGRRGRAGDDGRVLGPDAGADRPGAAGRGRGVRAAARAAAVGADAVGVAAAHRPVHPQGQAARPAHRPGTAGRLGAALPGRERADPQRPAPRGQHLRRRPTRRPPR